MVEPDLIMEQRIEALEQTERLRVFEQVTDLSERVARVESAWETEIPHLATKADIARLETKLDAQSELFFGKLDAQAERFDDKLDAQSEQLNSLDAQAERFDGKLNAQSEQFNSKLDALSEQFDSKLDAQSEQFNGKLDAQAERFDGKLVALSEQLQRKFEQRMNQQIIWIIGTGIALATFIANRMPS